MSSRLPSIKRLERQFARLATNPAEESVAKRFAQLASRYDRKPVEYASDHLGRKLTPKQVEVLESLDRPPYRSLVRSANSQGKCVHTEDRIPLADGSMVQAKDLVGAHFQVLTLVGGKTVPVEAFATWDEVKPVYRIELESGQVLRRTGNHPLWAAYRSRKRGKTEPGGWTRCDQITSEHLLAVPLVRDHETAELLTDDEVKVVAYLIGKGCRSASGMRFTSCRNDGVLEDFTDAADRLGFALSPLRDGTGYSLRWKVRAPQRAAQQFAERFGIWGCRSRNRFVPPEVFRAPKRQQALFLSRLYAADGWVFASHRKNVLVEVGYGTASERLCRDVQELLARFGIRSSVAQRFHRNCTLLRAHWRSRRHLLSTRRTSLRAVLPLCRG